MRGSTISRFCTVEFSANSGHTWFVTSNPSGNEGNFHFDHNCFYSHTLAEALWSVSDSVGVAAMETDNCSHVLVETLNISYK